MTMETSIFQQNGVRGVRFEKTVSRDKINHRTPGFPSRNPDSPPQLDSMISPAKSIGCSRSYLAAGQPPLSPTPDKASNTGFFHRIQYLRRRGKVRLNITIEPDGNRISIKTLTMTGRPALDILAKVKKTGGGG